MGSAKGAGLPMRPQAATPSAASAATLPATLPATLICPPLSTRRPMSRSRHRQPEPTSGPHQYHVCVCVCVCVSIAKPAKRLISHPSPYAMKCERNDCCQIHTHRRSLRNLGCDGESSRCDGGSSS